MRELSFVAIGGLIAVISMWLGALVARSTDARDLKGGIRLPGLPIRKQPPYQGNEED